MPPTPAPTHHRFGDFTFDPARRELRRDSAIVDMPVRVFECLACLLRHRDRAVGRDELLEAVFNRTDVSDGQLAQVVLRARRCVGDDGNAQHTIRTVPRFGFRWVASTVTAEGGGHAADVAHTPAGEGSTPYATPLPAVGPEGTAPLPVDPGLRTRHPAHPWRRGHRWLVAAIAVTAAVVLATTVWLRLQPSDPAPLVARMIQGARNAGNDATVVLPFVVEGDADIAWARLGLMDAVAERMRLAGLAVPPSENTLALLGTTPDAADRNRARRAVAAGTLVSGRVLRDGPGWSVVLDAEGDDGLHRRASATAPELLAAARLACDRLLAAIGRTAPAGDSRTLALDERLHRAKAALLANELGTARRILEAAPPSQLSAPQLRYRLAQVDYRAGDFMAAERALDALLAGSEAKSDPLFRSRLLVYRGSSRVRRNALAGAEADYAAAVGVLEGRGADPEMGAALNGRAIVRANSGRETDALADFGAARSHLQRAGDRLGVARVDANLGALELARGRPGQALDYLQGASAVFGDSAAINELQVTLSVLSAAHLQRLDPAAALAASTRALALLARVPDPTLRLAAHLDHANALVALGRLTEARAVLAEPGIAATTAPPYEQRRAQAHIALARAAGDHAAVVAIADAALAAWPPAPGDEVEDWIRLRRVQSARMADLPPANGMDVAGGDALAVRLVRAIGHGDGTAAGPVFRDALASAEARGAPAGIVDVATAYVPWLLRQGRVDAATRLVERVAPWAERCHACAVLQWQLAVATDDAAMQRDARDRVERLAGERPQPPPVQPLRR